MSDVALAIKMTADASDAASAFDSVGAAASGMAQDVEAAASKVDSAASRLDNVAASADNLDSKAASATGALGALSSGFELVGLDQYAGGLQAAAMATDFASGAGQALNLVLGLESVQRAKAAVQAGAQAAATTAANVATKAAAAGQWLLNAALSANPIGVVVVAVAALVAGVVLAYQKSETFRSIVQGAMSAAKAAIDTVVNAVKGIPDKVGDALDKFPLLSKAVETAKTLIVGYFDVMTTPIRTVIGLVQDLIDFLGKIKLPDLGKLGSIAGKLLGSEAVTTPSFGGGTFVPVAAYTGPQVQVTINGALDPVATGQAVLQVLRQYGVAVGVAVGT